ncbi:MAG: 1-acyl-sn-glycerol-3-phosphate acyltransferase, partial [Myxococcota bacterium]
RRWFELDVEGWEHVPASPVLLVSNHSGGTLIPDAWGFMTAWYNQFGTSRVLHPLAHEIIMSNPSTGPWLARCGALKGDAAVARQALQTWRRDVIVMPGGDIDTWRPYRDRHRVCFGGRRGYARLAARAQVPVVPVANVGAHETLIVLARGERLARWLRLPRLARARVFPVHLSLPYGLAVGPWPHLPPPGRLSYRIGAPIAPPPDADDAEAMAAFDADVRTALQGLLTGLAQDRRGRGHETTPGRVSWLSMCVNSHG